MIKYSNSHFKSDGEARAFVKECEEDFDLRLSLLSKDVIKEKNLRVVTLSGPTCSGKTTLSKKLISDFSKYSKKLNVISIDDFYYDKDRLLEISKRKSSDAIDYDSIDTIDIFSLKIFVEDIFDKRKDVVYCPVFDFNLGKRAGYKEITCTENDIFLFEGIQALYPQIRSLLSEHTFCGIYISAESKIDIDGVVFEPNEIRLMRRLVRDSNFRSTSAEFTFYLWDGVRKNEEDNIIPYSPSCQYRIDSVFACEISLLKPYLEEILSSISVHDPHYNKAQLILNKIKHVQSLPKEYISENSLYREFI